MEALIRVINKAGNVKFVHPQVAKSSAMAKQGYWIENVPKPSQTFDDYKEDGAIEAKQSDFTDLLEAKPGRKSNK